jgi:serine/threonine protein kinase
MPAPKSVDEFLDLVRKSGVVDDGRLGAYAQQARAGGAAQNDVKAFAGKAVRDGLLTYFQAEQLLAGKWKGFHIGKYKVLEKLGVGGMGQVFLCEHKLMRRRVAIKVLPINKSEDQSSLERFQREARAIAALDHPNIVRAYDIDQDDRLHFLVMEYVDGINMQELVKKSGPLDVLRACHYMYWSAVGLQHAHEIGIVHRDIKPSNILVDRSGVVKLLDMGLARFFHDEVDQLTKKFDENVLGTADYLAPEQAMDSHGVDIRADIYGLGATFYFLLTGKPLFAEGTVAQKLIWHQNRTAPRVTEARPDVPDGVAAVLDKMMAKRPDDRYQTPNDVVEALTPWVQTPIGPPPDKEMPQLCPAALGTAAGGSAFRGAPTVVVPAGPRQQPTSSMSMPELSAGPGASSAPTTLLSNPSDPIGKRPSGLGSTTTAGNAPTVPNPMSPIPAEPGRVWEAITADAGEHALSETARHKAPADSTPTSRSSRRGIAPAAKSNKRVLAGAFAGLAVATLTAGYVVWFTQFRTPRPKPVSGTPRTLMVSKARSSLPDGGKPYPTVRAAVEQAGAGDRIVLLDDVHEEGPITIPNTIKGLAIEAGNADKSVRWRLPEATLKSPAPVSAMLDVAGSDGFRLQGITFEAGTKADAGVRLGGKCPGATLEDVTVMDAKSAGVRLANAVGESGKPVVLERVRAVTSEPNDAGLVLAGGRGMCQHVQVRNSRFEGPSRAAVQIDGPLAEVEVRHCRVYKCENGVLFTGRAGVGSMFDVSFVNNTFHTLAGAGFVFDSPGLLAKGAKTSIAVKGNYFLNTSALARIIDPNRVDVPGLFPTGNVRNPASKEDKPSLKSTEIAFELPGTDPNDDRRFLRYGRNAPPATAGPNGGPVGVPPQE